MVHDFTEVNPSKNACLKKVAIDDSLIITKGKKNQSNRLPENKV